MALQTKRVTIGGAQYQITQRGAVAGRGLFKKFVNAIVPVLREAISADVIGRVQRMVKEFPAEGNAEQLALTLAPVVGPYIADAVTALPDAVFEELCTVFSADTQVLTGAPAIYLPLDAVFDDHFAGNYLALSGWFFQCLKVNGFLVSLGAAAKLGAQQATAQTA